MSKTAPSLTLATFHDRLALLQTAPPEYRVLEPRIAFDAAGSATVADSMEAAPVDIAAIAAVATSGGHAADLAHAAIVEALAEKSICNWTQELPAPVVVFVDDGVNDLPGLMAGMPPSAEIVILDATRPALAQMRAFLDGRTGLGAIHIVTHGEAGTLQFTAGDIGLADLHAAADDLAAIGAALTLTGDILVYGCHVGAGAAGLAFVDALARATGADVAASLDDTGGVARGGNWDLEVRTGRIEAQIIDAPDYADVLAPLAISVTGAPVITGSTGTSPTGFAAGGVGLTGVWLNAGSVGGVMIDLVAEVKSVTPGTSVSLWNQGDDPNVELFGTGTVAEAVIEWRVYQAGTGQTTAAIGNVKFFITDIDGLGGVPFTIESVRADLTGLSNYTVETGSSLAVSNNGSSVTGSGTLPFGAFSPVPSIRFQWDNVQAWQVTYREDNASTNGARYFRHDADGDFAFAKPIVVGIAQLDLDGDNSTGATGKDYQATFIENGAPVAIGDPDVTITHDSSVTLTGANIVLTNAQAGDLLAAGSLPVGITASAYDPITGTITLTGTASLANYQAAIAAITFANAGDNPAVIDRSISVRITDGVNTSDPSIATIHVTAVNDRPFVTDDVGTGPAGRPVTIAVLANDHDPDGSLDPASVQIVGTSAPGQSLVVVGQGTWSVNAATGAITFTPISGYLAAPTLIAYSVADNDGERSLTVNVRVLPVASAPHLDLGGPAPWTGAFLYDHNGTPAANPSWISPANLARFTTIGAEEAGPGVALAYDGSSVDISGLNSTSLAQAIAQDDFIAMTFTTRPDMLETWIQNNVKRNAGGAYEYALLISTDGFQTATLLSEHNPANGSGPAYGGGYPWVPAADFQLQPGQTYELRAYLYNAPTGTARWDDFYTFYAVDPTGHEQTFTEGGAAVSIAAIGVEIEDAGDATLVAGTVTLTNAQAGDRFLINGAAAADGDTGMIGSLTYAVTETAGTLVVSLTGTANHAAYQAALQAITFDNTSDAPSTVDRIVTVTVTDGIEVSNTAAATIHVIPVNDAPIGTPLDQASVDGAVVSIDIGAAFSDPDSPDIKYDIAGLPPGLTYDPQTGVITGTLTPDASQGGSDPLLPGVYTVTVAVTDGLDTTKRTLTFTVTNPAPDAEPDFGTTHENAPGLIGNVLANDHDGGLDTDGLSVIAGFDALGGALMIDQEMTLPSGAMLTLNADGTYLYQPNGAFDGLDLDERAIDTFTYTVADGQGGVVTATVTITIDGRNDAPQAGVLPARAGRDGDPVMLNLGALFGDPDLEPLTYTITGLPAGLTYNSSTGVVTGVLDFAASQHGLFAALGGGMTYLVQVAATDGDSEIVRTFYFTVTNPPPVAMMDTNTAAQNGPAIFGAILGNDGDGVNDGDALTLVSASDSTSNTLTFGTATMLPSGALLTLNADGTYAYDPNGRFAGVPLGQTVYDTVTYAITDGQGGAATATLRIAILGANDAPVVVNPGIADVTTTDGAALVPIDVSRFIVDPDGEPLTFALAASAPTWISLDPVTGLITGTPPADASQLGNTGTPGQYLLTIVATDAHNAVVTTTVTLTIVNLAPDAIDDRGTVSEDGAAITGNVIGDPITGDADAGPDADPVTVTAATHGGHALVLGTPFVVAGGGVLTLYADGGYTFDPGTAYNALDAGETAREVITYSIADGDGGVATASLVIVIEGHTDAPVIIDPAQPGTPGNPIAAVNPLSIIPAVISVDANTPASLAVADYVRDPEGKPLTYSAIGLPPGLTLDRNTGLITGTLARDASRGGPTGDGHYRATITVRDAGGLAVQTQLVYAIANPHPIAANDHAETFENRAIAIAVLANDHDTDGDALRVTTAFSPQGTVEILADGRLRFTPRPGVVGTAVITYGITDADGAIVSAQVFVTVRPVASPMLFNQPSISDTTPLSGLLAQFGLAGSAGSRTDGITAPGAVLAEVHRITRLPFDDGLTQRPGDPTHWVPESLSGFSLKFGGSDAATQAITLESTMRDGVLTLTARQTAALQDAVVIGYRITQADGAALPGWLERVSPEQLLGRRPLNIEHLDLRVTAILDDGREVIQDVRITLPIGEIKPLLIGKRSDLPPAMFADQFKPYAALNDAQVYALARALAA